MAITPDKNIPSNTDAEEALIGSLLIDPDVIVQVATLISPSDFYVQRLGMIYDAMRLLHDKRQPVDFLTVTDELERRGQLNSIGGAAFISSLINAVPSSVHAYQYATIIQRSSTLRQLISAAGNITRMSYEDEQDVDSVVNAAEEMIFAISEGRLERDLVGMNTIMNTVMTDLDELSKRKGEVMGVPMGFRDLDKLLGGLQNSDLIIVAARPGMGKTSLALSLALNSAKLYHKCVAIFSLEMSNEQLAQRLLSQESRINSQRLRLGQIREDEWDNLTQASAVLSETAIYIDDSAAINPFELRTKARRLHAQNPIDLLIIDYMQLMNAGGNKRSENRVQEISFISRSLKQLARELKVPVVALSQLSRQVENRADKHPQLSDLRESGSIEQDADVVMFVYRDDVYNEESDKKEIAEIIISKHRHGPTGTVDLYFEKNFAMFRELDMRQGSMEQS